MGGSTPSVLTTCRNAEIEGAREVARAREWSRKQRKHYHTVNTVLTVWEHQRKSVVWVMLSTATGGDARKLRVRERELRRRAAKKAGVGRIDHCVVDTTEGNGVLHVLWAADGSLYVEQAWLSDEWEKIHGASYVWIKRYRKGTRGRLARYMVSQYMAGQKGAGVRISWSWKKTIGIPIGTAWRVFKRRCEGSKRDLIRAWETFLRGGTVGLGGVMASMAEWARSRAWVELLHAPARAWVPVGAAHVCVTRFHAAGGWWEASSETGYGWQPC